MTRLVVRVFAFLVLLAVLAPVGTAQAAPGPPVGPPAYVVDAADVLSPEVTEQISGEVAAFELRTAHQLAVVTVPALDGRNVQAYARDLFDAWGIGRAGVDDGGLLLIAVEERRVRIQVGQGLRDAGLTDDAAVRIIDDITPILHRDDFGAGLVAGERAMRQAVGDTALDAREDGAVARFGGGRAIAADAEHEPSKPLVVVAVLAVFGCLVALVLYAAVRGDRGDRGGRLLGGGGAGGGAGAGGWGGGFAGGGGGGGGGAAGGGGGASGGF